MVGPGLLDGRMDWGLGLWWAWVVVKLWIRDRSPARSPLATHCQYLGGGGGVTAVTTFARAVSSLIATFTSHQRAPACRLPRPAATCACKFVCALMRTAAHSTRITRDPATPTPTRLSRELNPMGATRRYDAGCLDRSPAPVQAPLRRTQQGLPPGRTCRRGSLASRRSRAVGRTTGAWQNILAMRAARPVRV
eukprot:scaffold3951_cov121-Isochrysis_galbana.AAC.3